MRTLLATTCHLQINLQTFLSQKQNNPRKQVVVEVIPDYIFSSSSSSSSTSGERAVSTVSGRAGPSTVTVAPPGTYGCSFENPGEPVCNPESPVENVSGIVLPPSPIVEVGFAAGGKVFASPVWKVFGMVLPSPSLRVPVGVPISTPT